jgi:hypothetical protein
VFTLAPVADTTAVTEFDRWPVAAPSACLRLSAAMSSPEVGAVLAALADDSAPDPLRALLDEECLILCGGLLVEDTETGVCIPPSCCCGLEDWRDWVSVLDGGKPWLGHSPAPWVEHFDDVVRIWSDGGIDEPAGAEREAITVPLDTVAAQLQVVYRDLTGFSDAVGRWARGTAPSVADDLVAKLDASFQISGPLNRSLG